jgi:NADP-dependent 3-hydroxy acid dehydrogenase YdfG
MPRSLRGAVVVITGASSGIGRAAAHGFAREGAQLVLAARARSPLEDVAQECGGEPVVAPTDVRDEEAVQVLAARAVERFGRIDVWVNGAGVMVYGRFEDIPADVFRQVIETNVLGQVHGARAALAEFRRRGEGVLINMSSVWGRVTTPAVSPYVTSKFAVRAFSAAVRGSASDAWLAVRVRRAGRSEPPRSVSEPNYLPYLRHIDGTAGPSPRGTART